MRELFINKPSETQLAIYLIFLLRCERKKKDGVPEKVKYAMEKTGHGR